MTNIADIEETERKAMLARVIADVRPGMEYRAAGVRQYLDVCAEYNIPEALTFQIVFHWVQLVNANEVQQRGAV